MTTEAVATRPLYYRPADMVDPELDAVLAVMPPLIDTGRQASVEADQLAMRFTPSGYARVDGHVTGVPFTGRPTAQLCRHWNPFGHCIRHVREQLCSTSGDRTATRRRWAVDR